MSFLEEVVEVVPGVFRLPLPIPNSPNWINAYLITAQDAPTLVDCGHNNLDATAGLAAGLAQLGYRVSDLGQILVTHFHVEHYGSVGRLQARSGATVMMHPDTDRLARKQVYGDERDSDDFTNTVVRAGAAEEYVTGSKQFYRECLSHFAPAQVDRALVDGDAITVGDERWEVIETQGHAIGHLSFYNRDRRLMISGDHLISGTIAQIAMRNFASTDPVGEYGESLRQIRDLPVDLVLPGHGRVFDNYPEWIGRALAMVEERKQQLLPALENEGKTAFALAQGAMEKRRTFLGRRETLIEIMAYLEHFTATGVAEKTVVDGVNLYGLKRHRASGPAPGRSDCPASKGR